MKVLVGGPLVGSSLGRVAAIAEVIATTDPIGWSRGDLLTRVADVDALIALPSQRIDGELLDRAPGLKIVANHAVGVDNVDLGACRARAVAVTNTPGVLTEATADLAFALILDACRRVTEGDRDVRAGRFRGWGPTVHLGMRVHGATLGIIGFGRIGRAVAERARGFAMKVIHTTSRSSATELESLLTHADIVSVHAPLNDATRGLLSRTRLSMMKRGAVVINTARGALIDELALAELLTAGHLGGAGLDVYDGEPNIRRELLDAPRVVLAPHIGSADADARARMADLACASVIAALRGEPIPNRVV
jgi:glyoxylate reductase